MPTIEPTIQDVIDVLHTFSRQVDQRFDRLETRIDTIEKTMVTKDYLEDRLRPIEARLHLLEQTMILTREHLDKRITEVEKRLLEGFRRLDGKTNTIIQTLMTHTVLDQATGERLLST